ncbi:MAG: ATP-dependent DNA helicase [Betaproteobacteria bacterium]
MRPYLDAGSGLARTIPNYVPRAQQIEFADAVAQTIARRGQLIAEAGTGTGKTFAYLVPALLSGGKVIISTGTKNLQDQLFQRDLPTVRAALSVPVIAALLKGRSNYVCHYHLERTAREGRLESRTEVHYLREITRFAKNSMTGDKSELASVPEQAAVWGDVTSTRENCLSAECPNYSECFVMKARRDALLADVVVVNHHLFFADVMLKDEGVTELLPACNTVIFDEAHQLPDTATLFFGEQVTNGQIQELTRDATAALLTEAPEARALVDEAGALMLAARQFRLAIDRPPGKYAHSALGHAEFAADLERLCAVASALAKGLALQAERGEALAACARRASEIAAKLGRWAGSGDDAHIRWLDVTQLGWQLHTSPLSIATIFEAQIASAARAWIFTSATLAVNGDFSHYKAEMGLRWADTAFWASPFDYANHALLFVPRDMPAPNQAAHTEAVVATALPVLKASGGRAFLLFTSMRALDRAQLLVREAFERDRLEFPILVQGEGSRTELLERFRFLGNAVLLGSQSFWEGVDVRGEALSLVVIDKLPFAPPDDPVLQARLDYLAKQGGNPFFDYQVPQAAISLKQGAGRLIRSETDRGVLMICDPRLVEKSYGKRLWRSLPPMRRTRELEDVLAFFEGDPAGDGAERNARAIAAGSA